MKRNANTAPELEEAHSSAIQEGMSSKPEQELTTTTPKPQVTKAEAIQETRNTKMDLNEYFKFDVGYCKPPKDSWYAPGTSGNPNGRPTGSKNKPKKLTDENFAEILQYELFEQVKVCDGICVPAATAIAKKMVDLALGGNVRALQMAINCLQALDAAAAAKQEAEYKRAEAYKASFENPADRRIPIPHPKHVHTDPKNRKALFSGPRNEEELRKLLAGEDYQEESSAEEEVSGVVATADEAPDELRCGPREWNEASSEPEDRLERYTPTEEELLERYTPAEEEERLRKMKS